jgi:hypothetical protein
MTVLRVADGKVSVDVAVEGAPSVPGQVLRDAYLEEIPRLTFGLVRARDGSVYIGPLELLRFGRATVTPDAVEWPIEGGMLARGAGGRWRIESRVGRLDAFVEGYRPSLPIPLYVVTQLPVHRLFTRLFLLRVRGRTPATGTPASRDARLQAAAIDLAFCAALAGLTGKRRKLPVLLGIAAAYHVACWTISGGTLGGMVMRQRVVSVDGSRPTLEQSALRLLAAPLALIGSRARHDELAGTDVVLD